jgi:2'-5' RNA ligase
MQKTRKQLSMYAPQSFTKEIEEVRKIVDPIQSSLIPTHITLCREDEFLDNLELRERLKNLPFKPLTLSFGKVEGFSTHGLLLNCIEGQEDFYFLRECILNSKNIKLQKPHITLAHPRNPKAKGNLLENTSNLPKIIKITFPTIYLIEQEESKPWKVLEGYNLME